LPRTVLLYDRDGQSAAAVAAPTEAPGRGPYS